MAFVSGNPKPKLIRKEISKDVYRDVFKVTCPNCSKIVEHEIRITLTCPFCDWEIEGIETPKGL